jgi:hypothetical protein
MNAPSGLTGEAYQFALSRKTRGILTLTLILSHQGRGNGRETLFAVLAPIDPLGSRHKLNRKDLRYFFARDIPSPLRESTGR